MAFPARVRMSPQVNLITVEGALMAEESRAKAVAYALAARIVYLLDTVWRREPTLFVELGVAWTVGVWSATLLLFGLDHYPPVIAGAIGAIPEVALGVVGVFVAAGQIAAIIARHHKTRGYASFVAACWLGFLSFAILAGNYQLAGGWVYLGMAGASLLPFWRVVLDRRI